MAGGCWAATFRFSKFLSVILLRTMSSPSLERISFLPPSLMGALETGWRVAMFGELIANSGRPTKIWIDGGHASHAEQSSERRLIVVGSDQLLTAGPARSELPHHAGMRVLAR